MSTYSVPQNPPTPQAAKRTFKRASDFEPEEVAWLWDKRVPVGKFVIIDGDPGLGKSLITIDLIAKVTTDGLMVDSHRIPTGGVVLIAPEDGIGDTISPRLKAAGANLERVIVLTTVSETDAEAGGEYERPISFPEDIDILREAIEEVDARLVVIDPVMSVISGKADSHRDQDVRRAMGPVVSLAEKKRCSVVGIMHLSKGQGNSALYRTGGSIAFAALARSIMRVVVDPDNPDGRVLVHHKQNLSAQAASLCFEVVENSDKRPYLKWLGESTRSQDELLTPSSVPSESSQALVDILRKSKESMSTKEIAEKLGKEYDTVNRMLNRKVNQGHIRKDARGKFSMDAGGVTNKPFTRMDGDKGEGTPQQYMSNVSNVSDCPTPCPHSDISDNVDMVLECPNPPTTSHHQVNGPGDEMWADEYDPALDGDW